MNIKKSDLAKPLSQSIPDLFRQALEAQQANNLTQSEHIYRQILTISPNHSDSLYNVGLISLQMGHMDVAANMLLKAATLDPSADVYCLLGLAQMNNNQEYQAISSYQKALTLNPNEYMAHDYLGVLLCKQYCYKEGLAHFHQAIAINPNDSSALNNLALCLMQQGKYVEAASYFRQAITIDPHAHSTYHNLLLCLCFDSNAFPKVYLEEAARLDVILCARSKAYTQWPSSTLSAQQPLRVGLVSGDLNNHPVGYFLESILSSINSKKIEFFVYNTANYDDDLTNRIKPHIIQWVNISTLDDQQSARKIHTDGIHVLIDLVGHTAHNRLSLFAWRPAPIQVSWLGYFASTGLSFIDYFLADPISISAQNMSHFTEQVRYLPETRLCFTPPCINSTQELTPLPALNNGFITFGCFQTLSKVNDNMLTLWANILHNCPNSKLMFKNKQIHDASLKQELLTRLRHLGISSERIILEVAGSRANYLSAYRRVDFMLDTFPYPGGTTTCEALWMGIPTLTLAGNTLLEKQGAAMLSCVGLSDWITYNNEDYVQKAIAYAHNTSYLTELRQHLRKQLEESPLMNAPRFVRHFEDILFSIWHEKMG